MFLRRVFPFAFILFVLVRPEFIYAQNKSIADSVIVISDTTDLDDVFKRARNLAYNKDYEKSRRILNAILEKKSDYYDVRSFLARTFAWDQQYNEARTEFSKVLIEKPNFADALSGLIDVEMWTEQFTVANEYLKIALGYFPTSEEFLMKKVKVYQRQQDKLNASLTLRKILELNPGNKEALKVLNESGGLKLNNHIQFGYAVDFFAKKNNPQQLSNVEYGKSFGFGSFNLRGNYADKFGKGGWQSELDAYINFVKGTYVYLNGGYSRVSVFPDYKFGGDLYQKLFGGFEASLGGRYLHFPAGDSISIYTKNVTDPTKNDTIKVTKNSGTIIYTGYLGNYFRNYWFAVKAYYTPASEFITKQGKTYNKPASTTIILNIRYYFGDADNYLGIHAGSGQSPDEKSAASINPSTLKTISGGLELQRAAFGRWIVKGDIGYSKEETQPSIFLQRITLNISLKNIF